MAHKSSSETGLLRAFCDHHDEAAFCELVRRNLSMVLQVASRRAGGREAAEEIAQNVFIKFARKAAQLEPHSVVGAWLHRVTVQETIDFRRREYRRRRVMKDYHQHQQNAGHSNESADLPADVLDEVDEALAKMSDIDRSVIMLRFHAGMRFLEIAQRLGKSEEAARKQVSRAVGKLAKRLGHRLGRTVPTAMLVGSLPLAFSDKASSAAPSMVTTIAQTALAAKSGPASSLGFTYLFLIMKSKCTLAGLTILIAAFFSGRHTAAKFDRQLIEQAYHSSAQRAAMAERADSSTTDEALLKQGPTRSVAEILADAAAIAHDSSIGGYYKLRLLLAELHPEDYEKAIRHLEEAGFSDRAFARIGSMLAGLWSYQNGEAAMDWVMNHLDPATSNGAGGVLRGWSETDPAAAYARYQEMAASNEGKTSLFSFRWLAKSVFGGWAQADPESAIAALENVSIEDEDGAIFGIAGAVPSSSDPEPLLKAIANMSANPMRPRLIGRVASSWAAEEPHAAAAWIDSLQNLTAEERLRVKGEVAEEWMRYDSSQAVSIGAWFLSGAPASRREELTEMVSKEIARRQNQK